MRRCPQRFVLSGAACALLLGVGLAGWALAAGSSEAQPGSMHSCPPAGKWSIAVWEGESGTAASDALATCGADAVAAAYSLDSQTGAWSRWFAGKPEVSNLPPLNDKQGVLALGSATATPTPTPPSAAGKIAFTSDRDGNNEIYVMNADGSGQTNLTNNAAWDGGPAWSPDGSKIAFTSDRDGNDEIYVMNADGTGLTRLTDNPADDWGPAWSPDGSKIAFNSGYYEAPRPAGDIYVMNADGTGLTRLTDNPADDWGPVWSPDGSKIAFNSDRDRPEPWGDFYAEIYVMNADGSGLTNLTANPPFNYGAAWSPDGSKIAFIWGYYGAPGPLGDIYVMNADGTGRTNLNQRDWPPVWSPDGAKIAFASDRDDPYGPNYDGNAEIYVMNADGSDLTRLTDDPATDYVPAWSPDGTRIAFVSARDGNSEIYVMNADGTGQANLTNNPADDMGPVWSP